MAGLGFGRMSFELEDGSRHTLDVGTVKATEWKAVKAHTGKRPFEVLTEIDDPECLEALYWLVNQRAGNHFEIGGQDFDALAFLGSVEMADEPVSAPKGGASGKSKPRKPSSGD